MLGHVGSWTINNGVSSPYLARGAGYKKRVPAAVDISSNEASGSQVTMIYFCMTVVIHGFRLKSGYSVREMGIADPEGRSVILHRFLPTMTDVDASDEALVSQDRRSHGL